MAAAKPKKENETMENESAYIIYSAHDGGYYIEYVNAQGRETETSDIFSTKDEAVKAATKRANNVYGV